MVQLWHPILPYSNRLYYYSMKWHACHRNNRTHHCISFFTTNSLEQIAIFSAFEHRPQIPVWHCRYCYLSLIVIYMYYLPFVFPSLFVLLSNNSFLNQPKVTRRSTSYQPKYNIKSITVNMAPIQQ